MPLLSDIARRRKVSYFLERIPKDARVLDVGCGSGWLATHLRRAGWTDVVGLDIAPSADVVGDINEWKRLGLRPGSLDVIVAFEVVEHGDFWQSFYDLLKPGGLLLVTSPVPRMDRAMKLLERLGLNQPRTSAHDHLIDLRHVPLFTPVELKTIAGLSQWGTLRKPEEAG